MVDELGEVAPKSSNSHLHIKWLYLPNRGYYWMTRQNNTLLPSTHSMPQNEGENHH